MNFSESWANKIASIAFCYFKSTTSSAFGNMSLINIGNYFDYF